MHQNTKAKGAYEPRRPGGEYLFENGLRTPEESVLEGEYPPHGWDLRPGYSESKLEI